MTQNTLESLACTYIQIRREVAHVFLNDSHNDDRMLDLMLRTKVLRAELNRTGRSDVSQWRELDLAIADTLDSLWGEISVDPVTLLAKRAGMRDQGLNANWCVSAYNVIDTLWICDAEDGTVELIDRDVDDPNDDQGFWDPIAIAPWERFAELVALALSRSCSSCGGVNRGHTCCP